MMEDVTQMAGGGQVSGQDALTNLETTLRPVEKYAVRFLGEVRSCWYRMKSPVSNLCPSALHRTAQTAHTDTEQNIKYETVHFAV